MAKDLKWVFEPILCVSEVDCKRIDEFMDELNDWKAEGFTHLAIQSDLDGDTICVRRTETAEEYALRKSQEKKKAQKDNAKREADERKLLAKLKKKYE